MMDAKTTRSNRKATLARWAVAVLTTLALVVTSATAFAWEPESDYADSTTYMGLSGMYVLTNLGHDYIGQRGSKPIENINSVNDSGGLRFWIGHRPIPYLSLEVAFQWIAAFKVRSDAGKDRVALYSGSLDLKGYPLARLTDKVLEGRLQPYVVVSPMVTGGSVSATKRTRERSSGLLGFAIGVGGGMDYWLNESFSLNIDGRYYWGTGEIQHVDYATFALGARYHFE